MEYDELLSEYKRLLNENKKLILENERLRNQLNIPIETHFEVKAIPIYMHNQSTPKEKIKFFMSLFRGREDVCAKRWYSLKSEKSGYQPVCGIEWNDEFCDKRKLEVDASVINFFRLNVFLREMFFYVVL